MTMNNIYINEVRESNEPRAVETNDKQRYDYIVHADYEYEVNGEQYSGQAIYPNSGNAVFDSQKEAENFVDKNGYSEDIEVEGYYVEQNASKSFLLKPTLKDIMFRMGTGFLFGLLFIIAGIIVFFTTGIQNGILSD